MASNVLCLDVGERRIGVAIASVVARLPRPLTTVDATKDAPGAIHQLVQQEDVDLVVVGLPRNLSGDDTAQTAAVRKFTEQLDVPQLVFQDEALTSRKAEAELQQRGKPFAKGDVDALAATYILEDYLANHEVTA